MNTEVNPAYFTSSESEKFFRKKHTSTVSFGIGFLLFLLPFAEIRCNNMPLANNTGIGIAFGKQWKTSMYPGLEEGVKKITHNPGSVMDKQPSMGPNILTIAALVAGLAGLIFALLNFRLRAMLCMSAGILAALMLLGVMIQLKLAIKSQMPTRGIGDTDFDMSMILKLHFTIWYYTSLVAFMAAAFFSYKHHRIEMDDALKAVHQFEFQKESSINTGG
jgi:ABC-type branched-subunit amino acid transport system permease subunit